MPILEIEYGKLLEQTDFTHLPDESYLFLLNKSPATYEIDGKVLSAEAEQVLCCRPGQGISIRPLEKYLILDYVCFLAPANVPISQLELPERMPSHPPHFFELSDYFRRIFNLDNSADKYREQKMEAYLQVLIYALASGDENRPDNSHAGALHHQLRQLRRLISDDPTAFPTVEDAANYVGLSTSRFQHLYQQYFRTGYVNDRIRSRMFRARSLLKNTDLSVGDIARQLGYESETFFSRQFKQRIGVSPTVYRKMNI